MVERLPFSILCERMGNTALTSANPTRRLHMQTHLELPTDNGRLIWVPKGGKHGEL